MPVEPNGEPIETITPDFEQNIADALAGGKEAINEALNTIIDQRVNARLAEVETQKVTISDSIGNKKIITATGESTEFVPPQQV